MKTAKPKYGDKSAEMERPISFDTGASPGIDP